MKNNIITFFDAVSDRATAWMGSTGSIITHTAFFIGVFVLYFIGVAIDTLLLVLTTLVSLEAIYLAIFIQRSVNKQTEKLEEVEESLGEVEESLEEVEESLEDVEESIEEDDRDDEKVDQKVLNQLEEILRELKNRK